MSKVSRTFHLYRFQLLPIVEDWKQMELFVPKQNLMSREELIARKNELFERALREDVEFQHPRAELTHKLFDADGFIVLKIGANRSLVRITRDFEEETLDNWPSVYVVINNDPNVQKMAIELDEEAFFRTSTVAHILSTNLNDRLRRRGLALEIAPMFLKNEFWQVVRSHKRRITTARFQMIAPNLANISRMLELDLGEIKARTNSLRTDMSLQAPKGQALTLEESDSFTQSLVTYSSEGGGTVHLKVRGVHKLIKTEDSIRAVEIDEICFTGDNVPAQVVAAMAEQLRKVVE